MKIQRQNIQGKKIKQHIYDNVISHFLHWIFFSSLPITDPSSSRQQLANTSYVTGGCRVFKLILPSILNGSLKIETCRWCLGFSRRQKCHFHVVPLDRTVWMTHPRLKTHFLALISGRRWLLGDAANEDCVLLFPKCHRVIRNNEDHSFLWFPVAKIGS